MLKLQEFIRNNLPDFREKLSEKPYCIKVMEDDYHILFKYSQIESDFTNELVRECRGIILYKDDYSIACHPFHKFGNFGESYVPEIDWESSEVQEKIDGSIIKWWHSRAWNLWVVSTNGTIDAHDADLNYPPFENFADLFWYTVDNVMGKYSEICDLDKNKTYIFEIATPANRVVVPHTEYTLYHLATKVNETGEEKIEVDLGFPKPKRYQLYSLQDCVEASKELPFNDEGYVVVDKNLNRVKIKSPAYVYAHHIRSSNVMNFKNMYGVIKSNEIEEFLLYNQEFKNNFDGFKDFLADLNSCIDQLRELAQYTSKKYTRKEIALKIKDFKIFNSIFFLLLSNEELNNYYYIEKFGEKAWEKYQKSLLEKELKKFIKILI